MVSSQAPIHSFLRFLGGIALLWVLSSALITAQAKGQKYKVSIEKGKTTLTEVVLPVDPTIRLQLQSSSSMRYGLRTSDGKRLTFSSSSARTAFKINGQRLYPSATRRQLPPGPRGKTRHGYSYDWKQRGLDITQVLEIIPSRPPGKIKPGVRRKMDTLLVKYKVKNISNQGINFGLRVRIDMYNWHTDGPVFSAPETMKGQVLDGIVIQGKKVPKVLISMERGNLQNPGNLFYFTFGLGNGERPNKLIPTRHGAPDQGWHVQAIPSRGDSDIVMYWEEKILRPGETREIIYGYGAGIARLPESEGKVTLNFGGFFAPNKLFSITANVDDPVEGQALTLNLPPEIRLMEGPITQPVPSPNEDNRSIVMWKARILKPGTFELKVHSSNGVTQSRKISVVSEK